MGLVDAGVQLMLIGMGTVFVFLTALIGVTTLMSSAVNRFFPEATPVATAGGDPSEPSAEELAAIAAAIATHRQASASPRTT
ncbi:MAG: OadG family protein [Pseudomonadota bacterium]